MTEAGAPHSGRRPGVAEVVTARKAQLPQDTLAPPGTLPGAPPAAVPPFCASHIEWHLARRSGYNAADWRAGGSRLSQPGRGEMHSLQHDVRMVAGFGMILAVLSSWEAPASAQRVL